MVRILCERFTRLMPLWVVGLGAAGFFFPEGFLVSAGRPQSPVFFNHGRHRGGFEFF